ncbi:LppA family lipoprotein [Gordonia sp. (in: high G+C Gram-positive bacteria)]|uniref:LppA family lipoprotein n=1 Tax=Gordonia sp. (in: high G+C Gram-positive bacteria) TaxID=84139 RepID=UPI003C74DFCB
MTRQQSISTCGIALLLSAALAGCGISELQEDRYAGPKPSEVAQAAQHLRTLPPREEAEEAMSNLLKQVIETTTAASPGLTWRVNQKPSPGTHRCKAAESEAGGTSVDFGFIVSDTPVPDKDWPGVADAVRTAVNSAASTAHSLPYGTSGKYNVTYSSRTTGAILSLTSAVAAVIEANTGCRLTKEQLATPPTTR